MTFRLSPRRPKQSPSGVFYPAPSSAFDGRSSEFVPQRAASSGARTSPRSAGDAPRARWSSGPTRTIRRPRRKASHATFLIDSGMDARTVSDRLGHSSSSFTMNTYVHPAEQAQRRAARLADGMFAKTGRNV